MNGRPLRAYVARSLARGMVWWCLMAIALVSRELHVFHPSLLGM